MDLATMTRTHELAAMYGGAGLEQDGTTCTARHALKINDLCRWCTFCKFRPGHKNAEALGRNNYKPLRMIDLHFMRSPLSPYAVKLSPCGCAHRFLGESVMEVCVQIKVCEGCGCLWYRALHQGTVYCSKCVKKLEMFPSPETCKKRGRPARKRLLDIWALAAVAGGAE